MFTKNGSSGDACMACLAKYARLLNKQRSAIWNIFRRVLSRK